MLLQHLLAHEELLLVRKDVAVGLQIDLVQAHVALEEGQILLQLLAGGVLHAASDKVRHQLEIAIIAHGDTSV